MTNSTTFQRPAPATTALHSELLEITKSGESYPNPIKYAEPLIGFNGYYSLNSTGSFLSIDTNLMVNNSDPNNPQIIPHVVLVYSENGTDSKNFDLTGANRAFTSVAWDQATNTLTATGGNTITIDNEPVVVPTFSLTFTRKDAADFVTSTFTGFKETNGVKTQLNGVTYNNPIPMDMYNGMYYMNKGEGEAILAIGANNNLQYNYSDTTVDPLGLMEVEHFIYNLNMYVFSFTADEGQDQISIIMGTSAKAGMVCNNLTTIPVAGKKPIVKPRNLQTIKQNKTVNPAGPNNAQSELLAAYAGFYRFSGSNGFLSLEGTYTTDEAGTKTYTVTMGLSEDGVNNTFYTFDTTMSLTQQGGLVTLTIPGANGGGDILSLTFDRTYTPTYENIGSYYGYLTSVSGHVHGKKVSGGTLLNVVPVMGFAGAPMMTVPGAASNETIILKSDTCVEYLGNEYTELTVVPLMYIVAFKIDEDHAVILSLGYRWWQRHL